MILTRFLVGLLGVPTMLGIALWLIDTESAEVSGAFGSGILAGVAVSILVVVGITMYAKVYS